MNGKEIVSELFRLRDADYRVTRSCGCLRRKSTR